LLAWFLQNRRPMPWKGEQNPYFIWLSEVILQQTRVEQGLPYYNRFVARFPTVELLASAPQDEVMKLWEGLGYYSRARNLHAAAKHIAGTLGGKFPDTYLGILGLKGVGPYTAAAIASFAYGLPHAVVDGNVIRVLARFFGISVAADTTVGKRAFSDLAGRLIAADRPGDFNQALMDFGATVCVPGRPHCGICPMQSRCYAFREKKVGELPVKIVKAEKQFRYFNYLVVHAGDDVFIRKRVARDIWQNLYEFPMIETGSPVDASEPLHSVFVNGWACELMAVSEAYRQVLTHRYIVSVFREIRVSADFMPLGDEFIRVHKKKLLNFAFPRTISRYLSDKKW